MSAPRTDFTPDEILAGIEKALTDREFEVIPGLIKMLAAKDPERAQTVLDAFDIVRALRSGS